MSELSCLTEQLNSSLEKTEPALHWVSQSQPSSPPQLSLQNGAKRASRESAELYHLLSSSAGTRKYVRIPC